MMDYNSWFVCPHCGCRCASPQLFSDRPQRLFNYIWDNPGTTPPEMQAELALGRSIYVHYLTQIRHTLRSGTPWELSRHRKGQRGGQRDYHYYIQLRGINNAPARVPS